MVRSMMSQTTLPNSFWDYALESAACIINMVRTNKIEMSPYKVWHVQDPKLSYLKDTQSKQWVNPSTTHPRTKLLSTRKRHSPDQMFLYIDAEEHELGDRNEPTNYKVALSDPEYDKWLEAMKVEMQSIKDNQVWDLVDLHPNAKTVVS
ncbi:retrotransposon protein, putative, ty1-copia subclass [Tanacetum coccineum]